MPLACDPITTHVSIIDMPNSLNINFTGIYAFEHLFSIKFYEKMRPRRNLKDNFENLTFNRELVLI